MNDMSTDTEKTERMAEQLHVWYLEATQALDTENYNPKAQKSYSDLNDQQKQIDRYIARKVQAACEEAVQADRNISRALSESPVAQSADTKRLDWWMAQFNELGGEPVTRESIDWWMAHKLGGEPVTRDQSVSAFRAENDE